MADLTSSYIDFPLLLAPSFSSSGYASTAVQKTTDPSDSSVDLSPALARVLFDVQELDSRIDTLTRRSGVAALSSCVSHDTAAETVLSHLDRLVGQLARSYDHLEHAVLVPSDRAEQTVTVATRVCDTLDLLRTVGRVLGLARQIQVQLEDVRRWINVTKGEGPGGAENLLDAARKVETVRTILRSGNVGQVATVKSVHRAVIQPAIRALVVLAQERVQENLGNVSTMLQQSTAAVALSPESPLSSSSSSRSSSVLELQALHSLSTETKPNRFNSVVKSVIDIHVDETSAALSQGVLRHPGVLAQLYSPGGGTESVRRNINLILPDRLLQFLGQRSRAVYEIDKIVAAVPAATLATTGPQSSRTDSTTNTAKTPHSSLLAELDASSLTNHFFLSLSQSLSRSLATSASRSANAASASSFAGQYSSVINNLLPLSGLGLSPFRSLDSPTPSAPGGLSGNSPLGGQGQMPLPGLTRAEISRVLGDAISTALADVAAAPESSSSSTTIPVSTAAASSLLTQAIVLGISAVVAAGGGSGSSADLGAGLGLGRSNSGPSRRR